MAYVVVNILDVGNKLIFNYFHTSLVMMVGIFYTVFLFLFLNLYYKGSFLVNENTSVPVRGRGFDHQSKRIQTNTK